MEVFNGSFSEDALSELFPILSESGGIRIQVEYHCGDRRMRYIEETHRYTEEKSVYRVEACSGVLIVNLCSSGARGAFYALNEIQRRFETGSLKPGEYPVFPYIVRRGLIEGFYGTPWEQQERLSVLEAAARNGMNAYYYAPKDDPFHRAYWRRLYPDAELKKLADLVRFTARYYMEFTWCVAPGLDITYSSEDDLRVLADKIRQVYHTGVHSFGLLLDDIPERLIKKADIERYKEPVDAHADLICRLSNALRQLDPCIRLTVCPMQYHGESDSYYISKLGHTIPIETDLFWTGREVCSRELSLREAFLFWEHTTHKPLYWDNYPVNDEAMHFEMHLGPLINRDPALWRCCAGVVANVMPSAPCSVIPLITAAHCLWYGPAYDPEESYAEAIRQTVGDGNAADFALFADHLRVSPLYDENSPLLRKTFAEVGLAVSEGKNELARSIAEEYLFRLDRCLSLLRQDAPLFVSLRPWSKKLETAAGILRNVFRYLLTKDPCAADAVRAALPAYNAIPERLIGDTDFLEVLWDRYFV